MTNSFACAETCHAARSFALMGHHLVFDNPARQIHAVNSKRRAQAAHQFPMTDIRIVLSTAGSQEEARKIAEALVEQRLAACVNIVPGMDSVYRWQGRVETAAEWLLVMKTTAAVFPSLREALRKLHSYDVPECLMLAVEDGDDAYLAWIGESVH